MIKIDIVRRVATELNLKDKEALAVVDATIDALKQILKDYGRLEIRNFGVFQVKQRKPRMGRNPRTMKQYPIEARRVVTFKLGKALKYAAPPGAPPAPPVPSPPHPSDYHQPSLFPDKAE